MAVDPIQVDDGGSTRIKLLLRGGGVGVMDALLDVKTLNSPGKPYHGMEGSQRQVNHRNSNYGNVTITYLDSLGRPEPLNFVFAELLIISGDQRIHAEVLTGPPPADAGDVLITVFSNGCRPIVDAKQSKKQRRYVIANAPPIDQIFVTAAIGGPSVMVYQSPDTSLNPNRPLFPVNAAATDPVLYTSVVIT